MNLHEYFVRRSVEPQKHGFPDQPLPSYMRDFDPLPVRIHRYLRPQSGLHEVDIFDRLVRPYQDGSDIQVDELKLRLKAAEILRRHRGQQTVSDRRLHDPRIRERTGRSLVGFPDRNTKMKPP